MRPGIAGHGNGSVTDYHGGGDSRAVGCHHGVSTPPDFTVLGNLAFLTMLPLAFLIIGCVAGERRWKRIGLVVALFAVFELIGAGTGLSDVSGGLAGLLFIGLGAGVGGGLSYLVAPLYRRR